MRHTCMLLSMALAIAAGAQESYSPYVEQDFPTRVFWGDTHVHTSYSSGDANIIGQNTTSPEVAYAFARGETITAWNGMPARISRPLDFLVIADHAEGLGVLAELQNDDVQMPSSSNADDLREAYAAYAAEPGSRPKVLEFRAASRKPLGGNYAQTVWRRVVERAEAAYEPGVFTTFAGYEWTSPGSRSGVFGNLHRVVVYADGPDKTANIIPFSSYDSRNPEDLWAALAAYKRTTGGQVIAIPHNPNLSNGDMFATRKYDGSALDDEWVALRSELEPLVEITQQKGDSEAHPVLSPTDEFADFETWHSWAGYERTAAAGHPCCRSRGAPEFDDAAFVAQKRREYVRPALQAGLDLAAHFGMNPFQYGIIGSTDTHTSMSSADNNNFWAQYPNTPPRATRPMEKFVPTWERPLQWETAAAGYAAVWAEANTREAIFAALQRREVYATTGPRITVRMFAGFDFHPSDAAAPDIAQVGYAGGVPMGGTLRRDGRDRPVRLLLAALRDPTGAFLDRVQVIKGWRDAAGQLHERVYDVALGAAPQQQPRRRPDGSVAALPSTVNVEQADYRNTVGSAQLTRMWEDPDFDATERAFYYVRVLEIPTPRWPAYDARYFEVQLDSEVRAVTQERAYTSPIWYQP
ncbi:MAG: DUF3604 domain-containing protein [Pseudomonadota bacterium]